MIIFGWEIRRAQPAQQRRAWPTPPGFGTPFGLRGDPAMDSPGPTPEAPWNDPSARRREIYGRVFATVDGRAVLGDMLALAGVGRPDWEPGMPREDSTFNSGMKAQALSTAMLAGLETGALGRALVSNRLEEMADVSTGTED